jgi:predicted Zn-dependent protease
MVSGVTVSYSARCIDAATGKEAWAIKGKITRYYDYEEHVAALIAHEAVRQLKEQLYPPPPKPKKRGWPWGK